MNLSFWQNETPIETNRAKSKDSTYSFVIVGGGLSGFSIAYWLEKRFPNESILLIEKQSPAFGASGRNAGFLTKGSFNYLDILVTRWGKDVAKSIWKFSKENLELVQTHFNISSTEHFQKSGSLTYFDHSIQNHVFEIYDELSIPYKQVNTLELQEKYNIKHVKKAYLDQSECSINPISLLNLIIKSLVNTELKISSVDSIEKNLVVLSDQSNVKFDQHLFLACQTGLNELTENQFNFEAAPNEVVVTQPLEELFPGNYYDSNHMGYFRQLNNRRMIIGGYRPKSEPSFKEKLENYLIPVLHTSKPVTIDYQWSGNLNMTKKGTPYVENLLDKVDISVFSGFSGHGLGMIFHSAKFAVDKLGDSYSLANHFGCKS